MRIRLISEIDATMCCLNLPETFGTWWPPGPILLNAKNEWLVVVTRCLYSQQRRKNAPGDDLPF